MLHRQAKNIRLLMNNSSIVISEKKAILPIQHVKSRVGDKKTRAIDHAYFIEVNFNSSVKL